MTIRTNTQRKSLITKAHNRYSQRIKGYEKWNPGWYFEWLEVVMAVCMRLCSCVYVLGVGSWPTVQIYIQERAACINRIVVLIIKQGFKPLNRLEGWIHMMIYPAEQKTEVVPVINQHIQNSAFKGKSPYCESTEVESSWSKQTEPSELPVRVKPSHKERRKQTWEWH